MKKVVSVLLSALLVLLCACPVFAADISRIDEYEARFYDGAGPEVNGLVIDYKAFAPANRAEGVKYPLVVYVHGLFGGNYPGKQISNNNIPLWASEELQSRFAGTGGAFMLVPRSHEERNECWLDEYIPALKATIDAYIAENADAIDLSRIYIGGYSMGGKMTLKMLASYPDFFAAGFPMCPAYIPNEAELDAIADIPLWLIVSKYDLIAGWYTNSESVWSGICAHTNVPDDCRLSLMTTVRMPDGKKAGSNHHVWFAAANDLFTYDEGAYYNMTTVTASGEDVTLASPDGLISWLSSFASSYAGEPLEKTGLAEHDDEINGAYIRRAVQALIKIIKDFFRFGIEC